MDLIGEFVDRRKSRRVNARSNALLLDTNIGLEFEYEGVRTVNGINPMLWSVKEDHSLHNRGMEFTFSEPMWGVDAYGAIENMITTANDNGYLTSMRTGLHVHLDVRDMARAQLIGFLAYYTMFESAIYNWVGDDRDANNFCLPYYKATGSFAQVRDIVGRLFDTWGNDDIAKIKVKGASQIFHRYTGLNLKSLVDFGSLEFRHLKTTKNLDRVIDWINVIFSLKLAAQDVNESTSSGILNELIRVGPTVLLHKVFGKYAGDMLYEGFEDDFYAYGYPQAVNLLEYVDEIRFRVPVKKEIKHEDWEEVVVKEGVGPINNRYAEALEEKLYPKELGGVNPPQAKTEDPQELRRKAKEKRMAEMFGNPAVNLADLLAPEEF
jgi:hypothetical protein